MIVFSGKWPGALFLPLKLKMASTLHALGGILLNGLPTFFLVLILNFYLKAVFFKPLEETLAKRHAKTEGARKAAADALAAADARIAEHHAAIQEARQGLYEAQEKLNRQFEDELAAGIQKARADTESAMAKARTEIRNEAEAVTRDLSAQSEQLAEEIVASVLKGKAA
jgi:F-type H+-transporting ATPase subunit b